MHALHITRGLLKIKSGDPLKTKERRRDCA